FLFVYLPVPAQQPGRRPTGRRRLRGPVHPAQQGMYPRRQLPHRERLGQVVVRPDGQPDEQVGLVVACGEHEHRYRPPRLDPPAVYVCGVVLGNARLPHRRAVLGFADGLAWLAQIGLFVLLGLLVSPPRLPVALLPAVAIGLVLTLVARPLSAAVSTTPFRVPWREQAFISWGGLRGAVPIVFATIPLSAGVPGARAL